MRAVVEAYAKLNLSLDVTGVLEDGRHAVEMLLQSVSLADRVDIETTAGGIAVQSDCPGLPAGVDNLAGRAAAAFFDQAQLRGGAHIRIVKRIPVAGGLGGGSADAAAVLVALNELYGKPLDETALLRLGADLGADIPFCMCGGTMLATGFGESLRPLPPLPPCAFVLVKPERKSSTSEMYKRLDEHDVRRRPDTARAMQALETGALQDLCGALDNVFLALWEDTPVPLTMRALRAHGACYAGLSGSGPTVFGLFRQTADARRAAGRLRESGTAAAVCVPVQRGVAIAELNR